MYNAKPVKPPATASLRDHVDFYRLAGWAVEEEAPTTALVTKSQRSFSWAWFFFWWLVPGVGFFMYPLYRLIFKRNLVNDLYVQDGKVKRRLAQV